VVVVHAQEPTLLLPAAALTRIRFEGADFLALPLCEDEGHLVTRVRAANTQTCTNFFLTNPCSTETIVRGY
jgi:hypothetical protein